MSLRYFTFVGTRFFRAEVVAQAIATRTFKDHASDFLSRTVHLWHLEKRPPDIALHVSSESLKQREQNMSIFVLSNTVWRAVWRFPRISQRFFMACSLMHQYFCVPGPGPFDFLQSDQGGNLLHIPRGHLIAHGPGKSWSRLWMIQLPQTWIWLSNVFYAAILIVALRHVVLIYFSSVSFMLHTRGSLMDTSVRCWSLLLSFC